MLTYAQEEAENAGHSYIGTEHLLLGLLREPECLAAQILTTLGIESDGVRAKIEAVIHRHGPPKLVQSIPTSRVKRAIELAFEAAQKMRDDSVGSEHLLLGVVAEGEGVASHVLTDLGADQATIRTEIERLRTGVGVESQATRIANALLVKPRILVHDGEPPHRIWEGRITGHQGDQFQVEIADHPGGTEFLVEGDRIHPIPLLGADKCRYCQGPS